MRAQFNFGWRSSPGEGTGCPLQYSWASLVSQTVKNQPAMWETWLQSLCWEDPLEEGMATCSSILAWRIPMDRGDCWATVHGVTGHSQESKHSTQHTSFNRNAQHWPLPPYILTNVKYNLSLFNSKFISWYSPFSSTYVPHASAQNLILT